MKKLIFLALIGLFACSSEKNSKAICGKIIYHKNIVLLDSLQVKDNQQFCSDQTLETKIDSAAVIQFADSAVLTLKQNSKINLTKAKNYDPHKIYVDIKQSYGSSFSNVNRGKAFYAIKTPTTVAGVRGTSFEVTNTPEKTQIKLLTGSVFVRKNSDKDIAQEKEKIVLQAGEKITADASGIKDPEILTEHEKDVLRLMAHIEPGSKNIEAGTLKHISKSSYITQIAPEKSIAKPLTLEDLKKIYGKLATIETKDGYKYIGHFQQQGQKMIVHTTTKTFQLNVADVLKVTPYDK